MPDLTGVAALAALSQVVWLPVILADALIRPSAKPLPPPPVDPPQPGSEMAAKLPQHDSRLFSVPDPLLGSPDTSAADRAARVREPRDAYRAQPSIPPTARLRSPQRGLQKPSLPPPLPAQAEDVPSPFDTLDQVKRPQAEIFEAEQLVQRPSFAAPATAAVPAPILQDRPEPTATAASGEPPVIPPAGAEPRAL
jgi:hypothetical protein